MTKKATVKVALLSLLTALTLLIGVPLMQVSAEVPTLPATEYVSPKTPSQPTPYDGVPVTPSQITSANYRSFGLTDENWSRYNGYYAIRDAKELYGFAEIFNTLPIETVTQKNVMGVVANAVLLSDIVINTSVDPSQNPYSWTPIGVDGNNRKMFAGVFDGNGYSISGLYQDYTDTDVQYSGMFASIGCATVKNLVIKNSAFYAGIYGGAVIAKYINASTIEGIRIEDSVSLFAAGSSNGFAELEYVTGAYDYAPLAKNVYVGTNVSGGAEQLTGIIAAEINSATYYENVYYKPGNFRPFANIYTTEKDGSYAPVSSSSDAHVCAPIVHNQVNGTCERTGLSAYTFCAVCEKILSGEKTVLYGHESDEFFYTESKTDWTKHDKRYVCCTEIVDTSAHTFDHEACTVCGYELLVRETISETVYAKLKEKDVTLTSDLSLPEGDALWIPSGYTLTVPEGIMLRVNGDLINAGTLNNAGGTIVTGDYSGEGTVNCQSSAQSHPVFNEDGFCSFCEDETHPEAAPLVDGYYQIGNVGQLMWFSNFVGQGNASANAKLTADIVFNEGDLSSLEGKTDGYRFWTPIGMIMNHDTGIDSFVTYTGTFDGDGHTVSGLYHFDYWSYGGYAGLVSKLGQGGVIKNVTVKNSYFATSSYAGAILGDNLGGTVDNCHNVNTTVASAARVGGIVGNISSGTVRYCTNKGTVKFFMVNEGLAFNFTEFGGIAGNVAGTLEYCTNYGDITSDTIGGVGGITGQVYQGIVRHCVNEGNITVTDGTNFGGITGYQYHGTLSYNINYGTIQGGNLVGGIIGNPLGNGGRYTHNYTVGEKAVGVGSYDGCFAITETELANGRLAFELGIGQQIGVDARPYVGGPAVYAFYNQGGTLSYTNDANFTCNHAGGTPSCTTQAVCDGCRQPYGEIPNGLHDLEYTGGDWVLYCTICGGRCGEVQPHDTSWSNYCRICGDWNKPNLSEDGFYEIGSIGNLLWFAEQVNAGNYALNARVINNFAGDVTFRNYEWVPIGGSSVEDTTVGYEGIFDGQGYTIALFPEGMLVQGDAVLGLFGTLKSGAVVKNLSISNRVDGYLTTNGTTYTYDGEHTVYFGLIAGRVLEGATVSGCRVANGSISISNGVLGGIVGINYGTVENCVSYGMTLSGVEGRVGGIVGDYNGGTVENCYTTYQSIGSTATGYVGTAVSCEAGIDSVRMASGEIAYKMNSYVNDAACWYQNVGEGGPLMKSEDKYVGKIVYMHDFGAKILYSNNESKFILSSDYTVPEGATMTVPKGITLEIAQNVTLTNQGTLIVNGTLQGAGTLSGDGTFNVTDIDKEDLNAPTDFTFDGTNHYDEIVNNLETGFVIMGKTFTVAGYTRTLDFTAVQNAGEYTISYASASETIILTFRVNALQITDDQVSLDSTSLYYNAKAHEPSVILTGYEILLGRDYQVIYTNNVSAGQATATITFSGNFAGEFTKSFTIQKVVIGENAEIESVGQLTFTGKAFEPIRITTDGVTLVRDVDYTVEYANNVYPGTATATVTGIGSVSGQATVSFEILKPTFVVTVLDQIFPYNEDINVKPFDHTMYEGEGLVEGHTVVLGEPSGASDETITVLQILDADGVDVLSYYNLTVLATGKYHMFLENYRWDTTDGSHWRVCVYDCDQKADFEPHHGGNATCSENAVCIDCGVTYQEATGLHSYVNGVCDCGYDPGYVLVIDEDGNHQHSGSETGYSSDLIHMIFFSPEQPFVVVKDFEGAFAGVGEDDSDVTLDLFGHTIDMTNGLYGFAMQAKNFSVIFKSTAQESGVLIGSTSLVVESVTFTLDNVRHEGSLNNNGTIYVKNGATLYSEITNNGKIYLPEGYDLTTIISYAGSGTLYVGDVALVFNAETGKLECTEHTWIDADCTNAKQCSRCAATEGEALGHQTSGPATCETDEYCTRCESIVNQKLGHSPTPIPAVEPDCDTVGYTEGSKCARCDHVFTAPEEVPALGHTEGETVIENSVDPTCTAKGSHDNVVYCTVCHAELKREHVTTDALGHTKGETVVKNNVAPTCTEAGGYDNVTYCSVCDAEMGREHVEVKALGHSMGQWNQTVAPTCTSEGESRRDCEICDYYETETVSALGHTDGTEFEENLVDPTCTQEGSYDKVMYCGICGAEQRREHVKIEALGHTEGEVIVENNIDPTCTESGSYENVVYCAVCREELSREAVVAQAIGHNMGEWHQTVSPTCTTEGENRSDCSRCDYHETETVSALGHTIGDVVEENCTQPTCTEKGGYDKVTYCSVCDEKLSSEHVEIPAIGHAYESEVTQPTCLEKGYTTYTCHCGESYVDSYVDALGHTEEVIVGMAATCTNNGLTDGKKCTVCHVVTVAQQEIPASGHTHESIVTEPTCMERGYTTYICHCGESYVGSYVDALGHTEEVIVGKAATCTDNGFTDGKKCTVCNVITVIQQMIPAIGHAYESEVTEPTCLEEGYTTYTCHCGESYVGSYVDALGHTEEVIVGKAATCTDKGLTDGKKCTVCHVVTVAQQEIPASGHAYASEVTEPTCLEKGYTTYTCHCGNTYTDNEVEALGHSYGNWVITKQPSDAEDGIREKSCSVCSDKITESIPANKEETTEEITTEEVTTEEITTEEITTEEITTEEVTTEEVTTEEATTEEVTTEEVTTEEITTEEVTTEENTTEEATTEEGTTIEDATAVVTDEPESGGEQTTSEEKDGCRGEICVSAILILLPLCACFAFKKKKD